MATPRRNASDVSDVLVAVRMTPAERDALRDAARRADLTVSDYVRRRALPPVTRRKRSA